MKRPMVYRSLCALTFLFLGPLGQSAIGDLLLGTQFDNSVIRLDESTGNALASGIAAGSAGLSMTSGVTVGSDSNIYVSSLGTGEVLFYDGTTGQPLPSPHVGGRPGLFATLATGATPNSTPGPLKFGPDGHLYVSDFGGNQVRKFDGITGLEMTAAATVFVGPPAGLAFGPNGDLYVGDFGSASVVRVAGGVSMPFISPQSGGLMSPSSLLFLPSGELLVVDLFGDQILQYAADGSFVKQFAQIEIDLGDDPPTNADPTDNPSDIAYDADGNLLLAVLGPTRPPEQTFGTLLKFDLQGGTPLDTLLSEQTPLASVAWIASADAVAGDYNANGTIEPTDHEKWQADFGKLVAKGGGADGNGNGIVDAADYVIWRKALATSESAILTAALPEPSTATLMLVAAAWAFGARRRSA